MGNRNGISDFLYYIIHHYFDTYHVIGRMYLGHNIVKTLLRQPMQFLTIKIRINIIITFRYNKRHFQN